MYFLHSLQGQFWDLHFLIALRVPWAPLELNPKSSVPRKVLFTFENYTEQLVLKNFFFLKMVGAGSLPSLKNYVAKICRFLRCIGTDLSVSKRFSKDEISSLYTMRRHLLCRWFVLLFIVPLWNIYTKGQ